MITEDPRYTAGDMIEREIDLGVTCGPFHQQWLLQNAPAELRRRHRKYQELAQKYPDLKMSRQGFSSADINDANTAAFGARNTSAAELNILQDGVAGASAATTQAIINQYCLIAPNDARAGKTYRVNAGGLYGNTATPTIVITPRWGSNVTPATNITLGASIAWTSITGSTGLPYYLQFDFTIWTSPPGTTVGTGKGFGFATWGVPSGTILPSVPMGGTAATIDTTGQGTAGCGLTMNLTWSASSASNTSTCHYFLLQSLN